MPRRTSAPLSWPIERWPEGDRSAWHRNCLPNDPYDDDGQHYGATLAPTSLSKTAEGYGRWLCFLDSRGWLDPSLPPFERVTRRHRHAYFNKMKRAGNADYTIIGRFQELEMALKIMAPGQDTSQVRRLNGVTVYRLLPKRKRHLLVPDSGVLYGWGLEMMDGADPVSAPKIWLTTYRDGLLIAMLAARGRRRRSMRLLRVGKELITNGDRYRIELTPKQEKTKKADCFDLPERLTPYMQRYLNIVRPALVKGGSYEELWISRHGTPLTITGLGACIFRLSFKRFGQGFGPHRFRHSIATTLTLRCPENPGLGAAALGISLDVTDGHYIRAGQIEASRTYAELVEQRRRRLASAGKAKMGFTQHR